MHVRYEKFGLADVHVLADAEALAAAVAAEVTRRAGEAMRSRGAFHLALAGGRTYCRCYQLLRDAAIDWSRVHVYFSDERCLPADHAERNDRMAAQALLDHVPIAAAQVHRIPAQLGPEAAAAAYAELLAASPPLDLVLLGLGEDGHTASLFPESPALEDSRLAVPVHNAPKPPPARVSMGYAAINGARARLLMASGGGKAEAVARVQAGEMLPAARLASAAWFLDKEAAAGL